MILLQPVTRTIRKSTPTLIATVVAAGLLASTSRGLAASFTWTNTTSDVWTSTTAWQTNLVDVYTNNAGTPVDLGCVPDVNTILGGHTTNLVICGGGGSGGFPSLADSVRFTNNTTYAVNVNTASGASGIIFSNTAGVVTMGAGVNTLTVTGNIAIADGSATSTVYWSSGTLSVGVVGNSAIGHFAIGASNTNSVGYFAVTNGTVALGPLTQVGRSGAASVGTFVISGPAVVTNAFGETGSLQVRGPGNGQYSQLIISNGGKLFMNAPNASAAIEAFSNAVVLVSGTNSLVNAGTSTANSLITIGNGSTLTPGTPGSLMIVSNGATVVGQGTLSLGRGSDFNTGVVCGAGSQLISQQIPADVGLGISGFIVVGISGGKNNDLLVYNGGNLNCGGTLNMDNSSLCFNDSVHLGGLGAMSTGFAVVARFNSVCSNSLFQVTNAVFTCGQAVNQGVGSNVINVLAGGTLIFSNQYAVVSASSPITNVLEIESMGPGGSLLIDGGTVSAVSGSNAFQITVGQTGAPFGNSVLITNGGRLLSEQAEIGVNSSFSTGIVSGVGSVWSNYTAGVSYVGSNEIDVGIGSSGAGSFNYLAVQSGALLVNNGDLLIGNSASSTFDSALFGGPGAPAVIINAGSLTVGGNSASTGNTLTISNASVSAGYVRVRSTNTLVFAAGTLSAQGLNIDPGANGSNVFIVGDGTDAAYYDMAAGGDGYHAFGSPGLVVTNGASLRGSGTINGTTTVLGTFVPGFANSVGSIFMSNSLSFGSSAILDYDLGTISDSVTVNGNLNLGGTLNINNAGGFASGNTYLLFTYNGSLTYNGLSIGSTPIAGPTYTIDTGTVGQVNLVVSGGSSDPYTIWQSHYFPGGGPNAAGGADPDGDGMSNTNEFMAGFNPTNSLAYLHVISVAKTNNTDIKVIYLGANGDNTYSGGPASRTNVLEFTTGTANGSYATNNFASTGQTNILNGGTGLGAVTNMVDSGGATNKPSRYYRVRVLLP